MIDILTIYDRYIIGIYRYLHWLTYQFYLICNYIEHILSIYLHFFFPCNKKII